MDDPVRASVASTYLSATPYEQTNEYKDLFRTENPKQRSVNFLGAVPPGKTQFLTTYLGSTSGGSCKALLMAGSRLDMGIAVPYFGKFGASAVGRLVGGAKAFKNLRSLVDKPMDLPLQMKLIHASGEIDKVYTSNLNLEFEIASAGAVAQPMLASIWLTNPNPLNSGIFFFSIFFVSGATS